MEIIIRESSRFAFFTKKSASRDGTLLVRRDSLVLLPSSASSLPHPAACHHLFVLYRLLLVLHLLLILHRPSLASLAALPPFEPFLHPPCPHLARLPAARSHATRQTGRLPHSVAFSAVHLRVSQSVSQSLSQWVGSTRAKRYIVYCNYVRSSLSYHSRSFTRPFSFSLVARSFSPHLAKFIRVAGHSVVCRVLAACFSIRGTCARKLLWTAEKNMRARRVHCVYDSFGRVMILFQEVPSIYIITRVYTYV